MFKNLKEKREAKQSLEKDYVSAFGKLPVYPEFIKYQTSHPVTRELDRWYQKAYSELNLKFGESGKDAFKEMPNYQFIHYSTKALPLMGSCFSSCDSSGRRYPFVLLRYASNPMTKEFYYALPLLYDEFFQLSAEKIDGTSDEQSLEETCKLFDDLSKTSYPITRYPSLAKALERLNDLTVGDFYHSMLVDHHALSFDQFIAGLFTLIQKLRDCFGAKQSKLFRLALPRHAQMRVFVAFFLQLLQSLYSLHEEEWQIYWQAGGDHHQPSLIFSWRELTQEDWPVFVNQNHKIEDMLDFLAVTDEAQGLPGLAISAEASLTRILPVLLKER